VKYLLVEDVAALLGCSRDVVYRLTAADRLPYRKLGGLRRTLFVEAEIARWIENGCELEVVRTPHGGRIVRPVEGGTR
jgi:excisionase family DNA binding protein